MASGASAPQPDLQRPLNGSLADAPAGPTTPDLQEPLLPPAAAGGGDAGGEAPAVAESKRILFLGGPLVIEEVVSYASTLVAMGMVGRLGASALGAYTLAHSITNITGIALLNGVTGAVDTFGSQAHGSRSYAAIGLVLQRALAFSLATCAPLMLLYACAHPLLLALGQQAALAAAAARYIHLFAPVVPLHAINLCLYRTLASQGATMYVLAAGAVFFAATGPINWLLIFKLGMGLDGSALAFVACELIYIACLLALCALHNARRPPQERWWRGWSRDALRGWGPFLRLTLAATAMIVADWWLYDIVTLLAGLLPSPDVALAATGVIYNINTTVFMVPYGLAYAVCARVGALLGQQNPRGAKLAAEVGTAMGVGVVSLASLALLLLRHRAAALFTTDPAVIQACAALMLPLAALLLTNGTTALQSGILHGCGRQKHGAVVNGAANYALGLPLMLLFAFKLHGGAEGLWWGIAAASLLQAAVLVALVSGFDWRAEAERAARLVKHLSKADGLGSLAEEGGEEAQLSGARSLEAAVSGDALMPLPAVRGV